MNSNLTVIVSKRILLCEPDSYFCNFNIEGIRYMKIVTIYITMYAIAIIITSAPQYSAQ